MYRQFQFWPRARSRFFQLIRESAATLDPAMDVNRCPLRVRLE
jgi:hypothetical protein